MKRIVVNINFEFASFFKEQTGNDFVELIKNYLMSKFGESNVELTFNDEYNFEIDVDTGETEIEAGQLVELILEELGLKDFLGNGFLMSCFNHSPAIVSKFRMAELKFTGDVKKIKGLSEHLSNVVIGQDYAINTVVNGFIETLTFKAQNKTKPLLTFFFAGPEKTGKTLLARETVNYLGMPYVEFNSIDYTDEGFVRRLSSFINKHPNGALIFNDCEDLGGIAGIIYSAYVTGGWNSLSFRGLTVFFTTKCGSSLYKNSPRKNLSHLSSADIMDSCQREVDELSKSYHFHPLFLKALENEHIVMFNHLQTINYQAILARHIEAYAKSFTEKTGIEVELDCYELARFVIFNNPNEKSITKLEKQAELLLRREVENIIRQTDPNTNEPLLLSLEKFSFAIDLENADMAVKELFEDRTYKVLAICSDEEMKLVKKAKHDNYEFIHVSSLADAKAAVKKGVDLVLIDPLLGIRGDKLPVDIEDYDSVGNDIFQYLSKYYSKLPLVIISNKRYDKQPGSYQTLLVNKGVEGLEYYSEENVDLLGAAILNSVISFELDKDVESLVNDNLFLDYNPREVIEDKTARILLSKLVLRSASFVDFDESEAEYKYIRGFDDVVGNEVCKEELKRFSRYLSSTAEYIEEGMLPPGLILLYSYVGLGKTALVKAMAAETKASLITIDSKEIAVRGTDYVDDIKEAFKKARYSSPAIIHFKNINVLFGAGENIVTIRGLEALKAELNYIAKDPSHPIICIGECDVHYSLNDKLEQVATRVFVLPRPKLADIEALIRKYLKDRNITTVTKKGIHSFAMRAYSTYSNVIRALDFAVNYAQGKPLTDKELKESLDIFVFGDINVGDKDEHDVLTTSYHEIGHYLLLRLFGNHPSFVTIVSRGDFGGYTMPERTDKTKRLTRQYFLNEICSDLGGRAAEVIFNGDEAGITFGPYSDLMNATNTAKLMVSRIGMGKNLAAYEENDLMFNSISAKEIYDEINIILAEQYERALRLLRLNYDSLKLLAEAVYESKSLTGDELEELVPDDKLILE